MKRCALQGKRKFRDAGEASRFVWRGEHRGLYLCRGCGFYHLTKRNRFPRRAARHGAHRPDPHERNGIIRLIAYSLVIALAVLAALAVATRANASTPSIQLRTSELITATRTCETQLGRERSRAYSPWKPHTAGFRRAQLNLWTNRKHACLTELHRIAAINRNLYALAVCETGGINHGLPLWTHNNSVYSGALGFAHSTWTQFRSPGYPREAYRATPGQQMAVGRRLVERYGGYSSWPACHVRLGLPG